ncbi:MAG: OmpA family protein [Candidatus Kapabacteria bacterium]|nr:OmpA family protein [Candidatus Kapabacteria bacterium]
MTTNRKKLIAKYSLLAGMSFMMFAPEHCNAQEEIPEEQTEIIADTVPAMKPKYGVYVNYGVNLLSGDFYKLPTTFSCCKKFESGDGTGISFGVLYEHPLDDKLWLSFRLGYNQVDGLMTANDQTNIIVNGESRTLDFEHRLDASIGMINLDAMASYNFWDNFYASLGAKIGFVASSSFTQYEQISDPTVAVFEDSGLPYRNYYNGDIPDVSSLQLFVNAGLGYELPLNRKKYMFLVPEIYYSLPVTNLVSGITWKASLLKGGIALKYQTPPPPPPKAPDPMGAPLPEYLPDPLVPPTLAADISATQVDSLGNETGDIQLKIEDFISHNMRPMLNYIFFDENSATIPARYYKSTPQEVVDFNENKLKNSDVLPTYYRILDIIGSRLKEFSKAKITLTGTNSNEGVEANNTELSAKRAEAVRDYLLQVWNIENDRIIVKARNLPTEPSNSEEIGGNEENRRVEISSNVADILEPVFTIDTIRKIPASRVEFKPTAKTDVGIGTWQLVVSQNGSTLKSFSGKDELPSVLTWEINEKDESCPSHGGNITYKLNVTDKLGQLVSTTGGNIKVDQLTIDKKRVEGIQDKEFENYSLILFDYGKSKLGVEHKKTATLVKNRISANSIVEIIGYSDSMGADQINKRISYERANEFAKRIKIKNAKIIGMGEEELLYDNALPEGRFYCRTVKISIETPIER